LRAAKTASALLVLLALFCLAGPVLADGAFPDELSVYLPPNDPTKIMLGTNFGLVVSQDSGQSWRFICELYITNSGADIVNYYKIGADGAIIAITFVNLWRSSDGGCSWTRGGGTVTSLDVTDAFIDPNDPTFVLALALNNGSNPGSGIYPSHDGGLTFGPPLYTTTDLLTGIEIARSDGNVIYATQVHAANSGGQGSAYLLRSSDRGLHWTPQQLQISTSTVPRIAAVDAANADTVYLRLLALPDSKDQIAVTIDGGKTLSPAATLTGGNVFFTSFLRANDGTLYAGTSSSDLYVQPPGTSGFTKRAGPRARCLGQRIGESRTYACGDGFLDGYNLGYSDDGANTFKPMMKFTDIAGPLTCPAVQNFCAIQYQNLMQQLLGNDAGTSVPDGGSTSRADGSGSCATADGGIGALLALPLLLWRRRRPS
jgi:hypothetical protein